MADSPFESVSIVPSYARGFAFMWEISGAFTDPLPWVFSIEEGRSSVGDWTEITPPGGLVNQLSYAETEKRLVNKQLVLFFRVKLITPNGEYYSTVRSPYGELERREYLIVREIMRKEILQAQELSGVLGQLWVRSTFGQECTSCRDPVTGSIRNDECDHCFGTGRDPGFHGPYCVWLTFSPATRDKQMAQDGTGTREPYVYSVRMIGSPYAKDGDVVVDPRMDKRYHVDSVASATEIRRIPVIQTLVVREVPVSDYIHNLGVSA